MTGTDLGGYLLSEQDSEQIFREQIVPKRLVRARSVQHPAVVFVAGQPGAGKTVTTDAVVQSLRSRGGATVVNSDYYKPHHPAYGRMLAAGAPEAGPATSADGRRWMAKAQAYLIERRANAVVETTMRDPADFQGPAARFRDAGYSVEVAILAVSEPLSRWGIQARYDQQIAVSGAGRRTETSNHDASYAGVLRAAEQIDAEQIVDQVSVWRRGNHLLYANELTPDGEWTQPPRAAEVLAAERSRTLPDAAVSP